jgi:hypothetical protein
LLHAAFIRFALAVITGTKPHQAGTDEAFLRERCQTIFLKKYLAGMNPCPLKKKQRMYPVSLERKHPILLLGCLFCKLMKLTKPSMEPFLRYPELLIDSKEKAISVIKANCYYFYVVGFFSVILGCYLVYANFPVRENFIFGIIAIITGSMYLALSFLTYKFRSRLACSILIVFMIYSMVVGVYRDGLNAVGIFKLLLFLALYRMTKAVFYFNRLP